MKRAHFIKVCNGEMVDGEFRFLNLQILGWEAERRGLHKIRLMLGERTRFGGRGGEGREGREGEGKGGNGREREGNGTRGRGG